MGSHNEEREGSETENTAQGNPIPLLVEEVGALTHESTSVLVLIPLHIILM